MARLIHLDTDIGGDTDDLCALAMLLGLPDVELAGVTTCAGLGDQRAGFAAYALGLAGRVGVPVAAGADGSLGGHRWPPGLADPERHWPEPIAPVTSPPGAALDLLARSAERGATIVAIGPYTNLALLEAARPGLLATTQVVVMGGYVGRDERPRPGLPQWDATIDFNVQDDAVAARIVFERCNPLVVPLAVCLEVTLREAHLPALRAGGRLAAIIARQGALHGEEHRMQALGREHAALPDDLLNFQYDPLACAVAAGWDGVTIEEIPSLVQETAGWLSLERDPSGRPLRVVTAVDAARFERNWLQAVLGTG
jgi:inosine-uridine nucleoside N-ribohydrolase